MTKDTRPSEKKVRIAQINPPVHSEALFILRKSAILVSVKNTVAIKIRQARGRLHNQIGLALMILSAGSFAIPPRILNSGLSVIRKIRLRRND
jgi:hypothetical protein